MHLKLHSQALWNTYKPEQQEKLREWLIEQNLAIRDVQKRAESELGITCGKSTIHRIYQYLAKFEAANEVAEALAASEELNSSGGKTGELRNSAMKLLETRLLQKAMNGEANTKELTALGRIVLQSQERQIQQDRVNLCRERFQFSAAEAALEMLPLAGKFNKEDRERIRSRIEEMRNQIFRKELDKIIE